MRKLLFSICCVNIGALLAYGFGLDSWRFWVGMASLVLAIVTKE